MSIRPLQLTLSFALAFVSFCVVAESVSPKNDVTVTLTDLVDTLKGSGITIDSPVFVAESNAQAGIFSGYSFLFGSNVDEGVVFSTGDIADVVGANSADNTATQFNTNVNNDPLFGNVYDLVSLSFNVTPAENTLIVEYVFGSEEYNEFVNGGFNDFIRIFVGGVNCAVTANGLITSIDAINNTTNSFLYKDNDFSDFVNPPFGTEMDGFTRTVSCRFPVTPGVSIPVVIGMADGGDADLDSWAFFKAKSLRSEPSDEFGDAPDTYQTLSTSNGAAHTIIEGVYMGTAPSGDTDGFADGFDDSLSNAADDAFDDGVLTFPNLDADVDTSYSITVNATSINSKGATIIGWIDFDRDGQFQVDEASTSAVLAVDSFENNVVLTWPAIRTSGPDVVMGTSFARIRMVNDDELISSGDFAGIFLSGEVEDYQFQITGTGDITPPVIQIDALPTAVTSNVTAYSVTGTCTAGDNNVSVSVIGASPATPAAPANQSVLCSGGGTWLANFDVSALADGINNIVVDASQQDKLNNLANATQVTADKDILVPTVDIQNEPVFANTNNPFTVTFKFSEDVTGFVVTEMTVVNGNASNLVEVDASTYTADITPDGIGDITIDVAANVAQDIAGNNNTAAPQASITLNDAVDLIKPVISLIGNAIINFERGLSYFDVGATANDNIDGDITTNIVTVNPVDGNVAGVYIVTYDVDDAAGNSAVQVIRTVNVNDTVVPAVSIINQPASVNNSDTFSVTFQFTEIVTGFDGSDILLSNATLTNFVNVGSIGDIYTADITPNGTSDISVAINAGVAQDFSANDNTAAVTQIILFDNIPPNVVVTSAPGVNIANQASYPVSGICTAGDGNVLVLLSYGPAFFTPSVSCTAGGTWSTSFDLSGLDDTAVSGTSINVNGTQTDGAGNIGTAVIVNAVIDTVKPNVQIQNAPSVVNANEFTITIKFDEDVTGFDSSDISLTNATVNVASFTVIDAQTYTVGIVPDSGGDITLNVAANVALDFVGNDNNAAASVLVTFDNTLPTLNINASVVNAANVAVYSVGGNCENGGSDVTVGIAGAAPATQDVSCTAGNWAANFDATAIADGINVVTINASQTDAALINTSNVTIQVDKDILISNPTVNLLATNQTTPVITGTADTGTSNEIVVAGAIYTVTATIGNIWSLDTAVAIPDSGTFALVNGVNDVVVTSTDAAGNSASDVSNNEVILNLDDDNDGIPNIIECPTGAFDNTCPDADGDGIPDFQETDSDNDGIPDAVEVGVDGNNPIDSDGDSIPDYRDTDSDGDGIDDAIEGVTDSDGDGIPDYVEVGNVSDSDGDGIPDAVECPVYPNCPDTDGDNQPDYMETDSDDDGIDDAVEAGVDPTSPIDTDGDGTPDYRDNDSDGDGIADNIEGVTDNDGDGIPDYVDAASTGPAPNAGDSDGDGIADNIECELYPLCADSDNDSTPDYMEIDSDADGLLDVDEAGSALNDADNDGIDDIFDVDFTNGIDQNGDGVDDTQPLNTDGDSAPDYQDTDSDGDGIDDIVECPTGVPCPDADNDGIPDQLDASDGDASGTDIVGSGDSDNDGISDFDECITGIPCADVDSDGLPDYMDNNPDDGPAADPDGDGRLNYLDPDDDDDTIPDVVEDPDFDGDNNPATNPLDSDLDGTPDYLDTNSDGDGLSDFDESGSSGTDSDGDNIDDSYDIDITNGTDANSDGIDDNVLPLDSDGDTLPDYLDIVFDGTGEDDTDGDSIIDNIECPTFPTNCPDSDNDGLPDFRETDSDGDGINDAIEAGTNPAIPLDTDGDGTSDYQDTDSDNDGIDDSVEGIVDVDSDGIPDYVDADTNGAAFGGDSDGDGVEDLAECESYPNCADSDNDGTPDYMDAHSQPYNPNAAINTGLNGVGSNGPWMLLLIPFALLTRKIKRTVAKYR